MKLEVINGSFYYEKNNPLFSDVNFELEQGEVMSILGPNGIGKTTILKCIMGFNKWVRGKALIDSKPLLSIDKVKDISFVPQAHSSIFDFTVEQMVSMGCTKEMEFFNVPGAKERAKVAEVLKTVGIEDISNKLCSMLSGGQLQLVYIARALVSKPKLVIMDEPESHLDFKNQLVILRLIEKLNKETEMSFLINTHYPDHALRLSDKALIIGRDFYVFGKAEKIISNTNMKRFFEVDAKIFQVDGITRKADAFVVIE